MAVGGILHRDMQHAVLCPFLGVVALQVKPVSGKIEQCQIVVGPLQLAAQFGVKLLGKFEILRWQKCSNIRDLEINHAFPL